MPPLPNEDGPSMRGAPSAAARLEIAAPSLLRSGLGGETMRIAVMGSGGVGGYFGARLAAGGADVRFIARGAHLQAMRSAGLRIEGPDPMHVARISASDDPAEVGVVDLVMFCVKLWDTEAALQQIRPLVGLETAIVSFQNGVLKDRSLRAAYDPAQIMGGVGYVATTIAQPGVIRQTGPMQRLLFGEFDGSRSRRGVAFLEACRAGGINAELCDDIVREIWQKYGSSSACRERRRRRGCRSARSASIRRRARSCSTSCARSSRSAARTASTSPRTTPRCGCASRTTSPTT